MQGMSDNLQENYKDLAFNRKYRPYRWSDSVGNEDAKNKILNILNSNRAKPQSFLFTGDSGCGKTTDGRLLMKEYLCENRHPVNGACGECPTCKAMEEYIITGVSDMLPDVKEVDLTAEGTKGSIDALIEEMQIPSYTDSWKVYLLDECHEASSGAQNRLLKIVEEPPEKVLIIFCTTNPEKMLHTLKNRCQVKIEIKKPKLKELTSLLKTICMKEDITYDIKGLNVISTRSGFTIREALRNLESIVKEYNDATYNTVTKSFHELQDEVYFNFYRKLLNKDVMGYVTALNKIKQQVDLKDFLISLKDFTTRGIYVLNNVNLEGMTEQDIESYSALFKRFTVNQIGYLLNRLLDMEGNDIETKLLLLGYTGLASETEMFPEEVLAIENELALEVDSASKNGELKEAEILEQGINNTGDYTKEVSFNDMLSMFGGSEITGM